MAETKLRNIVATFYGLQSMFVHLIDAGLIMPERDEHNNFVGFVPNPGTDSENYNVRQMASVVRFLKYRDEYTASVANRYFVYLWYACMGEARHASDMTHDGSYPAGIRQDCSRERACTNAVQYSPLIPENRDLLEAVFRDLSWGGSFGGEPWADIVKAMGMYFVDKTTFVDLVHDLEHNGGSVFNKTSAAYAVGLDLQESHLRRMLDAKRDNDILTIEMYYQFIFSDAVSVMNPLLHMVGMPRITSQVYMNSQWYEMPDFGGKMLDEDGWNETEPEYRCTECGDGISEDEMIYLSGNYYCESCHSDVSFTCIHCDDTCHNDNMSDIEDVCSNCFYNHYTSCEKCGALYHNDDLHYVHTPEDEDDVESLLCEDCESELSECDKCGKVMWFSTVVLHHMGAEICACEECKELLKAQGYNEHQMIFPELEFVV